MVSVPIFVVAEEADTSEVSEIITEIQEGLDDVTISDDFLEIQDDFADINSVASTSTSEQITYLPDGIYAFQNFQNTSYYITNSSNIANTELTQYEFPQSPSIQYNSTGLFKVTKNTNNSKYVIRCYNNSDLVVYIDSNGVTKTISIPEGNTVPDEYSLSITSYNGAYVIHNSIHCISSNNNSNNLTSEAIGAITFYARWIPRGYRTHIEDGVYAFENIAYDGFWLNTQNASCQIGAHATISYFSNSPAESFSRRALFKVTQIGTTGRYVVRLMTNNLLTWNSGAIGSYPSSYEIPPDDSNVSAAITYNILYDINGFILVPYRTNKIITATASGTSGTPNLYLSTVAKPELTDSARWNMYKYTGSNRYGATVIVDEDVEKLQNNGAIVGQTYTLKSAVWTTELSMSNISFNILVSDNRIADITINTDTYAADITVNNAGKLVLYVSLSKFTGSAPMTVYGATYTYNSLPQIGTYYIQNAQYQQYVNVMGPSMNEGTIIHQLGFSTENRFKWEIEHVEGSGGYIRFKSLYSGLYIGVDPSNSLRIRQYSTTSDNTLWRFELLDNYAVKIICKASESSGTVLSAPLNAGSGVGEWLTQRAYTDDSDYSDEWYLHMFRDASFVALPENYDRSSFFGNALGYIETIGYTNNFNNHNFVNLGTTKNQLLGYMSCSKITLIRTHGSPTVVEVTDGYLEISDLIALPTNYLSYSELIIYGACGTALGGKMASNLVAATIYAGARTVIGFQNSVAPTPCNEWCAYFFQMYSLYYNDTSKTLVDVCEKTDEYAQENIRRYEYTNSNGDLVSLRNFVIAGATTFP